MVSTYVCFYLKGVYLCLNLNANECKRNTGKRRNYLQVCSLRPRDPMPTYPLQGIRATVVRLHSFHLSLCFLGEQRLKLHSTMLDLWRLIRLIMEWVQHVLKNATRARDRREFGRFEWIP